MSFVKQISWQFIWTSNYFSHMQLRVRLFLLWMPFWKQRVGDLAIWRSGEGQTNWLWVRH